MLRELMQLTRDRVHVEKRAQTRGFTKIQRIIE